MKKKKWLLSADHSACAEKMAGELELSRLTARVLAARGFDNQEKARDFMLRNIDKDIEIPAIAEYLNISYSSFRHTFKQYTGIAPSQYYINLKIQRAKDMLRSTSAPIKEISFQLHFDTPEYFTKLFKIKTGMTPSQFREQ